MKKRLYGIYGLPDEAIAFLNGCQETMPSENYLGIRIDERGRECAVAKFKWWQALYCNVLMRLYNILRIYPNRIRIKKYKLGL